MIVEYETHLRAFLLFETLDVGLAWWRRDFHEAEKEKSINFLGFFFLFRLFWRCNKRKSFWRVIEWAGESLLDRNSMNLK
jgi:hypothetical protein